MNKIFLILLFNLTFSFCVNSQVRISGKVLERFTDDPLPGVSVVEKGTNNFFITDNNGFFRIDVSSYNSILEFSFVGYETKEIHLNNQDSIIIKLEPHCYKDWFDFQEIGFYYTGGILNTPIGGQFYLSYPAFYHEVALKNRFSYQTNGINVNFINANISLEHLASKCRFDADIFLNYHKIQSDGKLQANSVSLETSLNFEHLLFSYCQLILGISRMDFNNLKDDESGVFYSPVIGMGIPIGRPINSILIGKVSIYKKWPEIQGELTKRIHRRLNGFVKFYSFQNFNEISLGLGFDFIYRLKSQRKPKETNKD